VCAVRRFLAGVKTLVPDTLAVAIAGKLIDHAGNFRRQLIGVHLIGIPEVLSHPLISWQNRQKLARFGGAGVICWDVVPLGESHYCQCGN